VNARDKLEAEDQRQAIFERDEYRCHHCGLSILAHGTPQLAHRIPATKANLKKYGPAVIHHPKNLLSCCSTGICNDSALIGNNPMARDALVAEIRAEISEYS
jgi:5-methylcytosine-specific restriction endonuclease McrA